MSVQNESVSTEPKAPLEVAGHSITPIVEDTVDETSSHETVGVEEGLAVWRRTLNRHRNTYRELAK